MGLLTAKQISIEVNLTPKTLKQMAAAEVIPGFKAPGQKSHWRFDLDEVKAALRHRGRVVSIQQEARQVVRGARAKATRRKGVAA